MHEFDLLLRVSGAYYMSHMVAAESAFYRNLIMGRVHSTAPTPGTCCIFSVYIIIFNGLLNIIGCGKKNVSKHFLCLSF